MKMGHEQDLLPLYNKMHSSPHAQNQTHMLILTLYALLCNFCAKLCQRRNNYLIVMCFESGGMFRTGWPLDLWGQVASSLPPLPLLSWEAWMSPAGRGLHNPEWPSPVHNQRESFLQNEYRRHHNLRVLLRFRAESWRRFCWHVLNMCVVNSTDVVIALCHRGVATV